MNGDTSLSIYAGREAVGERWHFCGARVAFSHLHAAGARHHSQWRMVGSQLFQLQGDKRLCGRPQHVAPLECRPLSNVAEALGNVEHEADDLDLTRKPLPFYNALSRQARPMWKATTADHAICLAPPSPRIKAAKQAYLPSALAITLASPRDVHACQCGLACTTDVPSQSKRPRHPLPRTLSTRPSSRLRPATDGGIEATQRGRGHQGSPWAASRDPACRRLGIASGWAQRSALGPRPSGGGVACEHFRAKPARMRPERITIAESGVTEAVKRQR